jgi:multidrug resistance efflux pump
VRNLTLSGTGEPRALANTPIQSVGGEAAPTEDPSRIRAIPCVGLGGGAEAERVSARFAAAAPPARERKPLASPSAPAAPASARPDSQRSGRGAERQQAGHDAGSSTAPQPAHVPQPAAARSTNADVQPERTPGAAAVFEARSVRASLFREQAQRAKSLEGPVPQLPAIGAPRWVALVLVCSALACSIVLGAFGQVEVTSAAWGALTVQEGPRPVITEVAGKVVSLGARRGQHVEAGQPLAQIYATELVARQHKDEEELALTRETVVRRSAVDGKLQSEALAALARKRAVLLQHLELKRQMLSRRDRRAQDVDTLAQSGAASGAEAVQARETAANQHEQLLAIQQQIVEVDVEVSDRQKRHEEEQRALAEQLQRAAAQLRETQALLGATEIRAPVTGSVESLLVVDGQVSREGDVIARIVPDGSLTRAVVFAPAKDAAFLREGLTAKVEFASLPVSEFGRARAHVVRVSSDVATPEELAEVVGAGATGPLVRVELELEPDATFERIRNRLRSGERLTARLTTRERRLIALLFDFLRQWYPE